jgi:hypothetical protein
MEYKRRFSSALSWDWSRPNECKRPNDEREGKTGKYTAAMYLRLSRPALDETNTIQGP